MVDRKARNIRSGGAAKLKRVAIATLAFIAAMYGLAQSAASLDSALLFGIPLCLVSLVILWMAAADFPPRATERIAQAVFCLVAIGLLVGDAGLRLGVWLFPDSNLLGGLALLFAPILWASMAGIWVCAVWLIVLAIRRTVGRQDQNNRIK